MQVDESTSDFSADYEGEHYVFCSKECLDRFESSPTLYVDAEATAGEAVDHA